MLNTSSSSSSFFISCLEKLHPGVFSPYFPQHHHISPLNSYLCVLQLQLKFSFSVYSLLQILHIFMPNSSLPFLLLSLYILCSILSLSDFNMLISFDILVRVSMISSKLYSNSRIFCSFSCLIFFSSLIWLVFLLSLLSLKSASSFKLFSNLTFC